MGRHGGETIIKKYANRRLYNTGTSTYVTLEDLAKMVKRGEEFKVQDAKTSEDITHAVLTQIIVEQEAKTGNTLLPTAFLRQLISYYGDQMQMVVPTFLEHSMKTFSEQQSHMQEHMSKAFCRPVADQELLRAFPTDGRADQAQYRTLQADDADVHALCRPCIDAEGAAQARRLGDRRAEGAAAQPSDQARSAIGS